MEQYEGLIAVVTGGGSGMGRELVAQLAAAGCHVATCDLDQGGLAETAAHAQEGAKGGAQVLTHVADIADEEAVKSFRDAAVEAFQTDHVNLLFNNAGIGGGASFVNDDRSEWERTFNVDWLGAYLTTRTFMPLLLAADEGHIVNTSSVNGFWASLGPKTPNTAYSAAKFAIKGFTESLIIDFRLNAPHLHAHVVMPGHIGTSIILNTARELGYDPGAMDDERLARFRTDLVNRGLPIEEVPDDDLRGMVKVIGEMFRDNAPVSAAEAATVILDGVLAGKWRILVGADAEDLDRAVRENPEDAYSPEFFSALQALGHMGGAV